MDLVSTMILALLAAALLIALVLIVISGRRRARGLEQALAEGEQIRGTVAALQAEVSELKSELKQSAVAPEPMAREFVPPRTITPDQRAEALEMLGRGADSAAVSSSTGLSQAEVELLQKVQNLRQSDSAPTRPKTR